jgi:hypothetical protein
LSEINPDVSLGRQADERDLIEFAQTRRGYPISVWAIAHAYQEVKMGLIELLLIVLVIAAIAGGIGVSPLLWLLLLVAVVILLTSGGFGYRRGGRI